MVSVPSLEAFAEVRGHWSGCPTGLETGSAPPGLGQEVKQQVSEPGKCPLGRIPGVRAGPAHDPGCELQTPKESRELPES